ncbi:MAG: sigma-70 family RNA polymerase sigma factor [Planctomycetes bacterium]|nr:sigma-70 family RNA polymerase sigma factor [Planctomycetota bacterium]
METSLPPGPDSFPGTRWSRLCRVTAGGLQAEEGLAGLVQDYWRPVYRYVRMKWSRSHEDAKDLTQSFFAAVLEGDFLAGAERERGSFRAYLKASLDNFVRNEHRDAGALKRGGGRRSVPLDITEEAWAPASKDPDALFEREWLRATIEGAVERMRGLYEREGRSHYFGVFRRYHLDETGETYNDLAAHFGVSYSDVINILAHTRARFREIVEKRVRETVATPQEFRDEIARLLGGRP